MHCTNEQSHKINDRCIITTNNMSHFRKHGNSGPKCRFDEVVEVVYMFDIFAMIKVKICGYDG